MNITDIISHKVAGVAPANKLSANSLDKNSSNVSEENINREEDSIWKDFPYDLNDLHPNDAMDACNWLSERGLISHEETYFFIGLDMNSDHMRAKFKKAGSPDLNPGSFNVYAHLAESVQRLYAYEDDARAQIYSGLLDKLTSAFNPPHPNSSKVHYMA